jgi:hypothetical protein
MAAGVDRIRLGARLRVTARSNLLNLKKRRRCAWRRLDGRYVHRGTTAGI